MKFKNCIIKCGDGSDLTNKILDQVPGGDKMPRDFEGYTGREIVYLCITNGECESWDLENYTDPEYDNYKRITAKEFLKEIKKPKAKGAKKGYHIETKEVQKKIPTPKYRRGMNVLISVPLGTFESYIKYSHFDKEKGEWVYTIPHELGVDNTSPIPLDISDEFPESGLSKYIID